MLTADLVCARRRGSRLEIPALAGGARARAVELAEQYLGLASAHVGATQEQLRAAWNQVDFGPRERKLGQGLRKLIEDACDLAMDTVIDPQELRGRVFLDASRERRRLGREFGRQALIEKHAEELEASPDVIESALFADLRSQHVVRSMPPMTAAELVGVYESAHTQAVLLRAVKVSARIRCSSPQGYRELFRALKFHRLLYVLRRAEEGYELDIDGPYSMFDSVTKYGLQLALAFGALRRCDRLSLTAEVRWGATREKLTFEYAQDAAGAVNPGEVEPGLRSDVASFVEQFSALASDWRVEPSEDVLDLPGEGVCVPDLVFSRGLQRVYLEVLGFWSRDAVWKRVELVERGLPYKVLFAAGSRLRVSEELLPKDAPSALYVYRGSMSARSVLERVDRLARGRD